MKYKVTVILLLVIFECNGHASNLGDILSSAHKRVEGVAGAILGGFNLFGSNRQNRPQNVPQTGPEETIIVVVEEPGQGDYGNNHGPMHHRPTHHHHHHHHHNGRPPYDNDAPPPPPPPHHGRPPFNNGPPPPHGHHHQRPHGDPRPEYNNQNQGHQNEYGNNGENGNNFYGNNQNDRPYDNNNGNSNNNGYQPNSKGTQEDQDKNYYDNNKPTTEYYKSPDPTIPTQLPKKYEPNTTEKPSDTPLFVPLSPNEYVYGGDKINISGPKRETDKTKSQEPDDENFDIDIRLKNE